MTEKELAELVGDAVEKKTAEMQKEMSVVQEKYKALHDESRAQAEAKGAGDVPAAVMFGRFARVATMAKGDPEMAVKIIDKTFDAFAGKNELKGYFGITAKNVANATVPSEGGITVPEVLSSRVIEVLYANAAVQKCNVTKLPLNNGNLTLSRMDSGALVSYFGEAKKVSKTQPVWGSVKLSGKKLGALVPISRDLIRSNDVSVDAWIVRDLQRKFALRMDRAMLYGLGTTFEPSGLSNLITGIGSSSTAFTTDTPLNLVTELDAADAPADGRAWIMHPRMFGYIANLKSTTGNFIYREEMSKGTLWGIPIVLSTQSGYTSTGTYNTSSADIFLGSWPEYIWADQMSIEIIASNEASFDDGSGTLQSAFQQDLQLIRAIGVHDFNIMHPASFLKSTNKFAVS